MKAKAKKRTGKITKLTVRDYGSALSDAAKIVKDKPAKTSLNSYVIEAILEFNSHNKPK